MKPHNASPWRLTTMACLGLVALAAGQAKESKPTVSAPAAKDTTPKGPPRVELEIVQGGQNWGTIVLELNEEKAPITVKNFLRYVDEGFYDGTIFHRVISTFMIQAGGFTGPTERKTKGMHKPIKNECKNGLKNKRGTIAMARTGDPHSATSQFFINVADNKTLDYPRPGPNPWGYCVFGKVVKGMGVVDRIKSVETRPSPNNPREKSMPVNPPVIKKARRVVAKHRVLILCSGNSARSQMAEALWRHHGGRQWEVFSAGITPKESVAPLAIKAMIEVGIDIRNQKPKSVNQFLQQPFDLVVTVCAKAEKKCPALPQAKRREHWPIDNPAEAAGSEEDKLKAFRRARDQLAAAIQREIKKTAGPAIPKKTERK